MLRQKELAVAPSLLALSLRLIKIDFDRMWYARALVAAAVLLPVWGHQAQAPFYVHNATLIDQIRHDLLENLDPRVPPSTDGVHGIVVKIQLRIFKVINVDIAQGLLVLKVWRRVTWFDDRLAWDPSQYGGLKSFETYPTRGDALDDNVWRPDVVMYNSITSQEETLETGAVWVRNDGRMWWSVPGTIDVTCRYSGLVDFPDDVLSCPIEIASWSLSDLVTNLTFFDDSTDPAKLAKGDRGCAEISAQSEATAVSYQEYVISKVECQKHTREYPCCPGESWTQLWIRLYMKRADGAYFFTLVFPGIIITVLTFGALFLDVASTGERLGFSSTMLLTNLVLALIASEKLPTCGEYMWIQLLYLVNSIYCAAVVAQSCYVTHICFEGFKQVDEELAEKWDSWFRLILPSTYSVVLAVIYGIRFEDGYQLKDPGESASDHPMFAGMPPKAYLGGRPGHFSAVIIPVTFTVIVIARSVHKKYHPSPQNSDTARDRSERGTKRGPERLSTRMAFMRRRDGRVPPEQARKV